MSKETVTNLQRESNVVKFPVQAFRGYILPPLELRTEPQLPWVSVDFHREDPSANWVYAVGAVPESFVEHVELETAKVSGL